MTIFYFRGAEAACTVQYDAHDGQLYPQQPGLLFALYTVDLLPKARPPLTPCLEKGIPSRSESPALTGYS